MKTAVYLMTLILIGVNSFCQTFEKTESTKLSAEQVTVGGKTKGDITRAELLNSEGLSFRDTNCHISGFRMTLVTTKGMQVEYTNEVDGRLTPAMLAGIKKETDLYKVFFEYIKCTDNSNSIRSQEPLSFRVK
jgi:hypothetical protein